MTTSKEIKKGATSLSGTPRGPNHEEIGYCNLLRQQVDQLDLLVCPVIPCQLQAPVHHGIGLDRGETWNKRVKHIKRKSRLQPSGCDLNDTKENFQN